MITASRHWRLLGGVTLLLACARALAQVDPLPAWNNGAAKQAVVAFVQATTTPTSPGYVPPAERIATFDQDGTLWVEQPLYAQGMFVLERVPALVRNRPELQGRAPFPAVLEFLKGDRSALAGLTDQDLMAIVTATSTGMPVEAFQAEARQWLADARDPRWHRPYTDLTYLPMQQVLQYLQANGYKTYIVTGGGQDFVRVFSGPTYRIPPEQVIGSAGATRFAYGPDGAPYLAKEPRLLLNDNNAGKAENIHLMIDRRPRAAFGNSTGDKEMLEYTRGGDGARLAMLVLHDDARREYAYGPARGLPDSKVGTFTQALYDQAQQQGWIVVSMQKDWNRVFAFDP